MTTGKDHVLAAVIILAGINMQSSYCDFGSRLTESDEIDFPPILVEMSHVTKRLDADGVSEEEEPIFTLSDKRSPLRRKGRFHGKSSEECSLTSGELLRLLVALHQARLGHNESQQLRICNRMRPIKAIITDFRFLGRRRK